MADRRKQFVTDSLGLTEKSTDTGASDPMSKAIEQFSRNLTMTIDKKSSVIGLEFTNPNKTLSAEALRVLEAQYLDLRAKLYGDVQAPIVQVQQDAVGKQLAAADAALQTFKQQHDISNFAERRAILLKQQGELESALTKSEATIAEQTARLTQLTQQLGAVAGSKKGNPNAAAALQGMVSAYQKRQEEAATTIAAHPPSMRPGARCSNARPTSPACRPPRRMACRPTATRPRPISARAWRVMMRSRRNSLR